MTQVLDEKLFMKMFVVFLFTLERTLKIETKHLCKVKKKNFKNLFSEICIQLCCYYNVHRKVLRNYAVILDNFLHFCFR